MLGNLVVCYLFLGGTGAGLCLMLAVLGLCCPRDAVAHRVLSSHGRQHWRLCVPDVYRRLLSPGYFVALVLLVLGVVCLLADLGISERAIFLFLQPVPTFLTLGAWMLGACIVLALVLCAVWSGIAALNWRIVCILEVVVCVVASVVMVYTGLLLQSLAAVPLWATPWLPALFVASSISCGIACMLGISQFTGANVVFAQVLRRATIIDVIVITVEFLIAAAYLVSVVSIGSEGANGTQLAAAASVQALLMGSQAWLFWGGFVFAGLMVPLVCDVVVIRAQLHRVGVVLGASVCVLVGGFVMRFCVVEAGIHPVLMAIGA